MLLFFLLKGLLPQPKDLILVESFFAKPIRRLVNLLVDVLLIRSAEDNLEENVEIFTLYLGNLFIDLDDGFVSNLIQYTNHQVIKHNGKFILAVGKDSFS